MKNINNLTMIVRDEAEVPNIDGNGCIWIATCLETEEYYRIFESNREYQYTMTGPSFSATFHMNDNDRELGVCHFMMHQKDTKEMKWITMYQESYYRDLLGLYDKMVSSEKEEEKEKQYQLGSLQSSKIK